MRALLVVVVLAALAWSGYWLVGARALDRSVERWLAERREEGWVAETRESVVRGFPNRFDLTLTGLELSDPETGWAWSAPFFQVLALSYRPTEVIAVWPREQTLATPLEQIRVTAGEMRASAALEPGAALELDRATFVADGLRLASELGWEAEVETLRLAVRQTPAGPETYQIGVELLGLVPPEAARARIEAPAALPKEVSVLRLDAEVAFDRPWDRRAIEESRPQPRRIEIDDIRAEWGGLAFRAAGALEVGPRGQPEGRITVQAANWRAMLDLAAAAGAVPQILLPTVESALELLAAAGGDPDRLEASIDFRDGRMFYGPIPLGPAPSLVLR